MFICEHSGTGSLEGIEKIGQKGEAARGWFPSPIHVLAPACPSNSKYNRRYTLSKPEPPQAKNIAFERLLDSFSSPYNGWKYAWSKLVTEYSACQLRRDDDR